MEVELKVGVWEYAMPVCMFVKWVCCKQVWTHKWKSFMLTYLI